MALPDATAIAAAVGFMEDAWTAFPMAGTLFALFAVLAVVVFTLRKIRKILPH